MRWMLVVLLVSLLGIAVVQAKDVLGHDRNLMDIKEAVKEKIEKNGFLKKCYEIGREKISKISAERKVYDNIKDDENNKSDFKERKWIKRLIRYNRSEEFVNKSKIIERIKEKRKFIKEKIRDLREKYNVSRKKYIEVRHRGLKDPEVFRRAKVFVFHGIEFTKRWLERILIQVELSNMNEEKKNELTVKIERCLDFLDEIEEKINRSETPDELRINVSHLKQNWSRIMVVVKSTVGQLIVAKLENLLERLENVLDRIEERIGENNTRIIELMEDCREKIEIAKEKLREAMEKFEGMEESENPNELYLEGRKLIGDAKENIRLAFKDLKRIYVELRVIS